MSWFSGRSTKRKNAQRQRIADLVADGRCIDVADLDEDDEVIRIGFGTPDEYWRVNPGFDINPKEARVERGSLVLDDGEPLTDRSKLARLRKKVKHYVYAT